MQVIKKLLYRFINNLIKAVQCAASITMYLSSPEFILLIWLGLIWYAGIIERFDWLVYSYFNLPFHGQLYHISHFIILKNSTQKGNPGLIIK